MDLATFTIENLAIYTSLLIVLASGFVYYFGRLITAQYPFSYDKSDVYMYGLLFVIFVLIVPLILTSSLYFDGSSESSTELFLLVMILVPITIFLYFWERKEGKFITKSKKTKKGISGFFTSFWIRILESSNQTKHNYLIIINVVLLIETYYMLQLGSFLDLLIWLYLYFSLLTLCAIVWGKIDRKEMLSIVKIKTKDSEYYTGRLMEDKKEYIRIESNGNFITIPKHNIVHIEEKARETEDYFR